jgi:hypothetical protein
MDLGLSLATRKMSEVCKLSLRNPAQKRGRHIEDPEFSGEERAKETRLLASRHAGRWHLDGGSGRKYSSCL